MGDAGRRKPGGNFQQGSKFSIVSSIFDCLWSLFRAAGLENWQKELLDDSSVVSFQEGSETQNSVKVKKVRQRWVEGGVVLEQTQLKVREEDWMTWCIEGEEEEVANWLKEKGSIFAGGLVMGYPQWVCYICDKDGL